MPDELPINGVHVIHFRVRALRDDHAVFNQWIDNLLDAGTLQDAVMLDRDRSCEIRAAVTDYEIPADPPTARKSAPCAVGDRVRLNWAVALQQYGPDVAELLDADDTLEVYAVHPDADNEAEYQVLFENGQGVGFDAIREVTS